MSRVENGWKITVNSFKILKANQQLIAFPILSGLCIVIVLASFFSAVFATNGWSFPQVNVDNKGTQYLIVFIFYVINYFIVVFFNTALIHCTHLYFTGEEATIKKGLQFSLGRIGAIFTWALFAGTVGFILKMIQENSGVIGKIITGIIGFVWSIATFFVLPIIAYENVMPIDAIKRSSQIMKQKWGETLTSVFSFGLIQLAALIIAAIPCLLLGAFVHPVFGIALFVILLFIIIVIMSATETIFVSAVYHNVTGEPTAYFEQQLVDQLFRPK